MEQKEYTYKNFTSDPQNLSAFLSYLKKYHPQIRDIGELKSPSYMPTKIRHFVLEDLIKLVNLYEDIIYTKNVNARYFGGTMRETIYKAIKRVIERDSPNTLNL